MRKPVTIAILTFVVFTFFTGSKFAIAHSLISGQTAEYVLAGPNDVPAQNVVKLILAIGDKEIIEGSSYQWVHLKAFKQNGKIYALWALLDAWPGEASAKKSIRTARYIFREADGPAREYVHASTGQALIPELRGWDILFPTNPEGAELPFSEGIHYLGHDFTLSKRTDAEPVSIPPTERIVLQPDISVGTGRNYHDKDGCRVAPPKKYEIAEYSRQDMAELTEAGFNHFWVNGNQHEWIKHWPVFCMQPRENNSYQYPEMLYRSNMLGGHAYYDEPAIRAGKRIATDTSPAQVVEIIADIVHQGGRPNLLHNLLEKRNDIDLGDLNLRHSLPAWEATASAAWYLMRAGAAGVIHEGRHAAHRDISGLNAQYGCNIPPYPEYLLRYYTAILRGAARHFGCDWGVSIYGLMESQMAPVTFTMAYDAGARYFWFWTGQTDHIPYPEQVNLARLLKGHARQNPNRDMKALLHAAKTAIALPDTYTFEFEGFMYKSPVLHLERVNEHGVTYRSVLHNAAVEMERLLRLGIDFDIVYTADGFNGEGYDEVIYINPDATLCVISNGRKVYLDEPRTPPRPSLQAKPIITADIKRIPGGVKLSAEASGGCPPLGLGLDQVPNFGMLPLLLLQRIKVIWMHYPPQGECKILYGPKHELQLTESGKHRFRALTVDAYASTAEKWFETE